MFWRSVDLTGNQTDGEADVLDLVFWRSVDLTGNQTFIPELGYLPVFWRSVDLTGNQTRRRAATCSCGFGAVLI